MHRFVRATSVGVIAATFLLAGCSGSSGGPGGSPAAGSSSAVSSSTAPGGSTAPAGSVAPTGGQTATCKQLTFDQVQPLLKDPITQVDVTAFGLSGTGQECRFEGADSAYTVDVIVDGVRQA